MWASFKGDFTLVRQLMEQGANILARDITGMTSLMYAAIGGHANVVNGLIQQNVGIDEQNQKGSLQK